MNPTEHLNTSVRPQDDFFKYVNSTWINEHPIPESETRWGIFDVLRDEAWQAMRAIYESLETSDVSPGSVEQQARDFYLSGMNYDNQATATMQTLRSLLGDIDAIANKKELVGLFGTLHAMQINAPWHVWVDSDHDDSSKHILHIHQSSLTLPDRDYYLDDVERMKTVRTKYQEYTGVIYEHFPNLATSAKGLWSTVIDFETNLAQKTRTTVELRDVEKNFNKITFEELKKTYTNIDWEVYAKSLGWQPAETLSVDQPEVLAYVDTLVGELPLETWKTYLKSRVVNACIGKVSEEYAALHFSFFGKILSGAKEMKPLWKRVVLAADSCIGEATGRLYAERHFPESSKQAVTAIVEDVRAAYDERIDSLDWMSDPTKKYAKQKLANIKVLIGYPDVWRDFSSLSISPNAYLQNVIEASRFEVQYWLEKLHQPTSREDWFMNPQTVNAYHDPTRLVICFPAAILQMPFFDPTAPLAVNMGGIGTVIGHELTHGFDDQGYQFDAEGNVRAWQNEDERKAFAKKAQVIIDQANAFKVLPDLTLKGELVIGESMADLGGVEIALHAFKTKSSGDIHAEADDGFTQAQQFFINYAFTECSSIREEKLREYTLIDWHPASEYRVNGILQHVDDFYTAFSLQESDALYREPAERARIW